MQKDNFVLIIGNIVTRRIEKDGMNRRIVAIDDILADFNKIYIEDIKNVSTIRYWGRCFSNCLHRLFKSPYRFYNKKVDSYKSVTKRSLDGLFEAASCIYIHSLYSAMKIPLEYLKKYSHKIILDAHGCVVEEMRFGSVDSDKIKLAELYERELFPGLQALVCVSENMIDFYKNKYNMEHVQFIKLPIFTSHMLKLPLIQENEEKCKIIYSGGINKWQNVEQMVDVIKKLPQNTEIKIISPDKAFFENLLGNYPNVTIKSVPPDLIQKEYEGFDFGFILRDDIVVNHVACPTKLIEYIGANLIPIVSSPKIGDFERLGYKYITVDELLGGNLPDSQTAAQMKTKNIQILELLNAECNEAMNELRKLVKGSFLSA